MCKEDKRGYHLAQWFGFYVECGGSGKVWTTKYPKHFEHFLEDMNEVGQFLSNFFAHVCIEIAVCTALVIVKIKK